MESLDSRAELRASRDRHTHWETTTDPVPPIGDAVLSATTTTACEQVLQGEHGLATWRYRMSAGAALTGPEPSHGGGQFWVVLVGSLATGDSGLLPVNSTIFAGPQDGPLSATAGPGGAEALCLQFRVPYAARG
jgi:phage tail protein X